ncbi:MAG: Uma2 family endonuclease [Verrucomicrobia bacterium]|nr:MAG: Uma2 family endonuclease [Verrucomicrobiota bacterium]
MHYATVTTLSEADYLSGEAQSRIRHEYVDGYVYAMAGASKAHNTIAGNLFSRLRRHLRGSPCRGFIADMKVRVEAAGAFYYPDVVVTCSGQDTSPSSPKDYLTAPSLIVEVLSPTTETVDRREKMRAYASLDSLQEYMLIDSRAQQVEVYRKQPNGTWEQRVWSSGEIVRLDSVDLDLSFEDLYEDVMF